MLVLLVAPHWMCKVLALGGVSCTILMGKFMRLAWYFKYYYIVDHEDRHKSQQL